MKKSNFAIAAVIAVIALAWQKKAGGSSAVIPAVTPTNIPPQVISDVTLADITVASVLGKIPTGPGEMVPLPGISLSPQTINLPGTYAAFAAQMGWPADQSTPRPGMGVFYGQPQTYGELYASMKASQQNYMDILSGGQ